MMGIIEMIIGFIVGFVQACVRTSIIVVLLSFANLVIAMFIWIILIVGVQIFGYDIEVAEEVADSVSRWYLIVSGIALIGGSCIIFIGIVVGSTLDSNYFGPDESLCGLFGSLLDQQGSGGSSGSSYTPIRSQPYVSGSHPVFKSDDYKPMSSFGVSDQQQRMAAEKAAREKWEHDFGGATRDKKNREGNE